MSVMFGVLLGVKSVRGTQHSSTAAQHTAQHTTTTHQRTHHAHRVVDVDVVVLAARRLLHKGLLDAHAAQLDVVVLLDESRRVGAADAGAGREAVARDDDVARHGHAGLLEDRVDEAPVLQRVLYDGFFFVFFGFVFWFVYGVFFR